MKTYLMTMWYDGENSAIRKERFECATDAQADAYAMNVLENWADTMMLFDGVPRDEEHLEKFDYVLELAD